MGQIGEPKREIEFEPFPAEEPAVEPAYEPQKVDEPVSVP